MEFVNWDDDIPKLCGKIKKSCSSHHQPGFQKPSAVIPPQNATKILKFPWISPWLGAPPARMDFSVPNVPGSLRGSLTQLRNSSWTFSADRAWSPKGLGMGRYLGRSQPRKEFDGYDGMIYDFVIMILKAFMRCCRILWFVWWFHVMVILSDFVFVSFFMVVKWDLVGFKRNWPSGKRWQKIMESHHVQWENSLFQWPCSIAMLNHHGL